MLRSIPWLASFLTLWVSLSGAVLLAQTPPAPGSNPQLPLFDQFGGGFGNTSVPGQQLEVSASFELQENSREGRIKVHAEALPTWHFYSTTQPRGATQASQLKVAESSDYEVTGDFQPDRPPNIKNYDFFKVPVEEYDEVVWTAPIQLADGVDAQQLKIDLTYRGQVCQDNGSCIPVTKQLTAEFTGYYPPGDQSASATSAASQTINSTATNRTAPTNEPPATSSWDDKPIGVVLLLAFLAGLILNVMPCVLPVIGLKVMSFVQQAGEQRSRVLALNIWFVLGLLTVFMTLASVAVFLNFGWGDQLRSTGFNVALAGIVFVFGLSFFGVWEIPIPGFVGAGKANDLAMQEGPVGAYCKGILSTILATPCSGPLLIPALSWAVLQPPWLTYTAFLFVGLGMAAPYLLIGAFPALVSFLPKPGAWMETFKQLMGFVMMGTVVFILYFMDDSYTIATLTMLVGLGLACWWMGKVPITAELSTKIRSWAGAAATAILIAMLAFRFLVPNPETELPWQPFSRVALEQHLAEGNTVLVDFTADW